MPVPAFVGHAQMHLQQAWTHAGNLARNAPARVGQLYQIPKDWIIAKFNAIKDFWNNTVWKTFNDKIWTPFLKPLHERYIEPLDRFDTVYLTGSAIVAASIAVLTPLIFGKALFAIATVSSLTLVLGACTLASYRAQRQHSEKAWGCIEHMRGAVNSTTARQNHFTLMHQDLAELQKPLYNHHSEDIKVLAQQLESFKKVASAPYYEDRKALVTGLTNHLKSFVTTEIILPDQRRQTTPEGLLFESFEQQIALVGTNQQNFAEIENKRRALATIESEAIRQELGTLATRIDELRVSTEGISFKESKKIFDQQLKQFQLKLKGEEGAVLTAPDLNTIVNFT